jgi:2,4-dienoyl-CoA reductase-like NADH-dependent reductase (Old Yellow Enzyme family)
LATPSNLNQRADQYGGSFENRIRLLRDTARAVRQVWPAQFPLGTRISLIDWVAGGWDMEQSVALAKLLKTEGVDLIDCSCRPRLSGPTIFVGCLLARACGPGFGAK